MLEHLRMARVFHALVVLASVAMPVQAQTIDDGIMMGKGELLAGNLYSRERWETYWEGTLRRVNGNIGSVTTSTNVFSVNYGITNRLNVIGAVPYVWTEASQGVLHGIEGFQDITLAVKLNAFEKTSASHGSLRVIGVVAAGSPITDYNPELPPLSIGSGSTRVSWRGTVNYQSNPGWFLNSSAAYTWRSGVELDRPYFYTDDEFVMSNEVDMPNALEHVLSGGYMKGGLMVSTSFSQYWTLGGGDIRRQDMPFVSNRMNVSRMGVMVMAPVPKVPNLAFQAAVTGTIDGRNVGEASTVTGGILYRFNGASTQ